MSLINEALKRTRDVSFQAGQSAAVVPAPYRVTQSSRESVFGIREIFLVVIVGCVAASVVVGYLVWHNRPAQVASAPVSKPVVDTKAQEAELVQRLMEKMKTEQAVVTPAPAPQVQPPAPPSLRDAPKLILQGVMQGGKFDEAMINGFSYRVGDVIEDAKITGIENGIVHLLFDGREITLRMR